MKILIVDDHPVVRAGIQYLLKETLSFPDFLEAINGTEAINTLQAMCPDLVLLDLMMPGLSGLETLKKIKELHPTLPVIVISFHLEDQFAVRVLKAGGSAYLTKSGLDEDLITAIRHVLTGRTYVSNSLADILADDLGEKTSHGKLSDREYQIMLMLGSGKTISMIAQELFRSAKTISTHRSRILEKLGLKTTADLIRFAIQNEAPDIDKENTETAEP